MPTSAPASEPAQESAPSDESPPAAAAAPVAATEPADDGPLLDAAGLEALADVLSERGPAHADLTGLDTTRRALLEPSGPVAVDGTALWRLGRVLELNNDTAAAITAYNTALDALPADDAVSRAIVTMRLGRLLADRRQFQERAVQLTAAAATSLEALHAESAAGVEITSVIESLLALAHAQGRHKQISEAFATLQRGSELASAALPSNHPIRAQLSRQHGRTQFMNRRFAEARDRLQTLHERVSDVYGASSPLAISIADDLALALKRSGAGAVAVETFLSGHIDHVSEAYGVDHPKTIKTRFDALQTNLMIVRQIGRDTEERQIRAERVRHTAEALIDSLPPDSLDAADAWGILGTLDVQLDEEKRAGEAWKKAYDIRRARLGDDSRDTMLAYSGYGRSIWLTEDPARGRAIIDDVIARARTSDDVQIKGLASNLITMLDRLEARAPSGAGDSSDEGSASEDG